MKRFESERCNELLLKSEYFTYDIPLLIVNPKNVSDSSSIILFTSGLGNSNALASYMNNELFDNNWFISYEKAMHGDNKNTPSQFKKAWLNELDSVVEYAKKKYPGRKIFLIGESWGSAINFVYYKKHKSKIAGTLNWNSPFKIINPEKVPFKLMFKTSCRQLSTFLFNTNKLIPHIQSKVEMFTSDPILARLMKFEPEVKRNTRATMAAWRFMRPAYNFIKKYGKNPDFDFLYIQTKDDILQKKSTIKTLIKHMDDNHLQVWESGKHILQFEPLESDKLFKEIHKFISKN